MDPVDLGVFDMSAGRNTISFTIAGKNAESDGYSVGFDWLRAEPLREAGETPGDSDRPSSAPMNR